MTAQDYVLIIGALTTFVGAVSLAAVTVIKALKENTAKVIENTADRAVKTAETTVKLDTIASQVQDIHSGTGTGITVNVPPAPEP